MSAAKFVELVTIEGTKTFINSQHIIAFEEDGDKFYVIMAGGSDPVELESTYSDVRTQLRINSLIN